MRRAALLLVVVPGLLSSAAPAASPFLVFFEQGSTRLVGSSGAVLDNVAQQVRALEIPSLTVAAHADRLGSSAHNLTLSRRRAEAVRDALFRRGLTGVAIEIEAYGEDRPLVDTGDGLAEPQNRRAEIVIRCMRRPVAGLEHMRC